MDCGFSQMPIVYSDESGYAVNQSTGTGSSVGRKKQMQLAVITRFAKTSLIPMILTILLLQIGRIRW